VACDPCGAHDRDVSMELFQILAATHFPIGDGLRVRWPCCAASNDPSP
jgi:hypothetical protein